MGEMSCNRVGGIYIYDRGSGSGKGADWSIRPINLLCDRRNVNGGGKRRRDWLQNPSLLSSSPPYTYLFTTSMYKMLSDKTWAFLSSVHHSQISDDYSKVIVSK
jgi:hypothetical protein